MKKTINFKIIDEETMEKLVGRNTYYDGYVDTEYQDNMTGCYSENLPPIESEKIINFLSDNFDEMIYNEEKTEVVFCL